MYVLIRKFPVPNLAEVKLIEDKRVTHVLAQTARYK